MTASEDALDRLTTYEYDAGNRMWRQTDALNGTHVVTYNLVGSMLNETDEEGRLTSYEEKGKDMQCGVEAFGRKWYNPVQFFIGLLEVSP
jgi:YD repeat-containing protein